MKNEEVIKEIERELAVRRQVYPRLIQDGKLNQLRARHQYAALLRALEIIREIDNRPRTQPEQKDLFHT